MPCWVTRAKALPVLGQRGRADSTPCLSLLGRPSLTPGLQAPGLCPSASLRRPQSRPRCLAGSGWRKRQGGKRQEGQQLQEPAGPGQLLNRGARPSQPPQAPLPPGPARPPSSALQTFLANLGRCSPGRGNCADTAHTARLRLPETLNPFPPPAESSGGGMGLGGGPRVPRLGATRSGDLLVVQAGPRSPTWTNRRSVRLTQAPPGFWALRLAAGTKTQQGGPLGAYGGAGNGINRQFQVFPRRSATKEKYHRGSFRQGGLPGGSGM